MLRHIVAGDFGILSFDDWESTISLRGERALDDSIDCLRRMVFCSPKKISLLKRFKLRRAIALLSLLSILLAALPIPIGWKSHPRSGSQAFPCQSCHCGCSTPEQCWTNCCCYTPEERRTWAIKNGVEPPSYAVLAEPAESQSSKEMPLANSSSKGIGKCCADGTGGSPTADCGQCQPAPVVAKSTCPHCNSAESPLVDSVPISQPGSDATAAEPVLVLSLSSIQCRGGSSPFTLLPWAIVKIWELNCFFPEPIVAPYEVHDEWFLSLARVPDVPPPRS
jgi:hypothetical protein